MNNDIGFLRIAYLSGPNIWSNSPVIEACIDIGSFEELPSDLIPGFKDRLVSTLPGLADHHCSIGRPGGFIERLERGTWIGHILEHVAIEIQRCVGIDLNFGKTRTTDVLGVYKLAFASPGKEVGTRALLLAKDYVLSQVNDTPFDLDDALNQLATLMNQGNSDVNMHNFLSVCKYRGIPVLQLNENDLLLLGYGEKQRRVLHLMSDSTSDRTLGAVYDKNLFKKLLNRIGLRTTKDYCTKKLEEAWEIALDLRLPVAVKSSITGFGNGIFLNCNSYDVFARAYKHALRYSERVYVEEQVDGQECRFFIINQKVIAIAMSQPIYLYGDGVSTVQQLCSKYASHLLRHDKPYSRLTTDIDLELDFPIKLILEEQGLTPSTVAASGKEILLQHYDSFQKIVTDEINPEVKALVELAARALKLDIACIDLILDNIHISPEKQKIVFMEVNAGSGLMPQGPLDHPLSKIIVDAITRYFYPKSGSWEIPIVGITGTKNTGLIARLINKLLLTRYQYVGLASSEGAFISDRTISHKNAINKDSYQQILSYPLLQTAVLQHDVKTILGEGLFYDRCRVGIVTDFIFREEYTDYYTDSDELYRVLQTQIDSVLIKGHGILNASYPKLIELADQCYGEVIFYANERHLSTVNLLKAQGKTCLYIENKHVKLAKDAQDHILGNINELSSISIDHHDELLVLIATGLALDFDFYTISKLFIHFAKDLTPITA